MIDASVPLPLHLRRADGYDVVLVRRLAANGAVRPLVLQHDDRVLVADGRLQKALRVVRRRRSDHLQPGGVCKVGLDALRVVQPAAHVPAVWGAQHHRHVHLPIGAVPYARGLPDHLVHRRPDEVRELHLGDGPQAGQRRADRYAGYRGLRQRRVDDALLPELLQEALGGKENAAAAAHVLAHHEHGPVARHLLAHRVPYRLYDRDHCHRYVSLASPSPSRPCVTYASYSPAPSPEGPHPASSAGQALTISLRRGNRTPSPHRFTPILTFPHQGGGTKHGDHCHRYSLTLVLHPRDLA